MSTLLTTLFSQESTETDDGHFTQVVRRETCRQVEGVFDAPFTLPPSISTLLKSRCKSVYWQKNGRFDPNWSHYPEGCVFHLCERVDGSAFPVQLHYAWGTTMIQVELDCTEAEAVERYGRLFLEVWCFGWQ